MRRCWFWDDITVHSRSFGRSFGLDFARYHFAWCMFAVF